MSAPKYKVSRIDLDTMTVEHIGYIHDEDALKHPNGWVVVTHSDGTWMRTDKDPEWRKISDGKAKEITTITAADRPASDMDHDE